VELNWTTFLLEAINFFVLVWILKRVFYQPVRKIIDERKAAIDRSLLNAEQIRKDARDLQTKYENRLNDWEQEKATYHAALLEDLAKEKKVLYARFEKYLEEKKEKIEAKEKQEREDLIKQAEKEAIGLASQFMTKLLKRLAGPDLEKMLVNLTIEELSRPDATTAFEELKEIEGEQIEINAKVQSAFPLEETQKNAIETALSGAIGRTVQFTYTVNPEYLSGLYISLGSFLIRANLKDELKLFEETRV